MGLDIGAGVYGSGIFLGGEASVPGSKGVSGRLLWVYEA